MEQKDRIALLESNLGHQLQWISWSDTKTAFVFTLAAAMVGLLASTAPDRTSAWSTPQAVSASFATASFAACFLFLSLAAFPRTDGPKGSLVYCGGIEQREEAAFCKDISVVSAQDYAQDLASQCHRNAAIACAKFKWVQRALITLYLAVVPWAISIWLLYNPAKS